MTAVAIARWLGNKIAKSERLWPLFSEIAIPIMKKMAITGDSTDKCLKHGFLPVPINSSRLMGPSIEPEKYREFFMLLAHESALESDWPTELGNKIANSERLWSLFSEIAIPIMEKMTITGDSTDKCLKHGFLPVPTHFFQHIPDAEELERRKVWDKVSSLRGIDFEPEKYLEFFMLLAHESALESDWPNELGNKIAKNDRLWSLFSDIAIPIMKKMAITGESTDKCRTHGFLPVPIHFYHPVPDIEELEKRNVWDKISHLTGINFEPEKYLDFMKSLAHEYAHECEWPNEPSKDPWQFHLHNGCFSYGCAAPLHCIIRGNKPKRIIEIGSGNSSKLIAAAIELNLQENCSVKYSIVDPYTSLEQDNLPSNVDIIRKPVELLDIEFFESLEEDDILFIDSSHVSKMGSDVNFLILDILPTLKNGVYIHFHDVNLPYEYPKIYATNPGYRIFWSESYLLQAFLIYNNDFKIVLPMDYMQRKYINDLKSLFPHSTKTDFGWVSGSFWIKRVAKT